MPREGRSGRLSRSGRSFLQPHLWLIMPYQLCLGRLLPCRLLSTGLPSCGGQGNVSRPSPVRLDLRSDISCRPCLPFALTAFPPHICPLPCPSVLSSPAYRQRLFVAHCTSFFFCCSLSLIPFVSPRPSLSATHRSPNRQPSAISSLPRPPARPVGPAGSGGGVTRRESTSKSDDPPVKPASDARKIRGSSSHRAPPTWRTFTFPSFPAGGCGRSSGKRGQHPVLGIFRKADGLTASVGERWPKDTSPVVTLCLRQPPAETGAFGSGRRWEQSRMPELFSLPAGSTD